MLKRQCEQRHLSSRRTTTTTTTNITSTKPRPPQRIKTATQEQQQQWLETQHVLSRRYVFFYLIFYFITLIFFLGLVNTSKRRWEQHQLETHDHTPIPPTSSPGPPQRVETATQEQQRQQGLETRHVSSPRYVFYLFHFFMRRDVSHNYLCIGTTNHDWHECATTRE
jgi:hypothetical protein